MKTESANILRVFNTEYVRPSIIGNIDGYTYDGPNAKDIEVCLRLLFNVFRVRALYSENLPANGNYASWHIRRLHLRMTLEILR